MALISHDLKVMGSDPAGCWDFFSTNFLPPYASAWEKERDDMSLTWIEPTSRELHRDLLKDALPTEPQRRGNYATKKNRLDDPSWPRSGIADGRPPELPSTSSRRRRCTSRKSRRRVWSTASRKPEPPIDELEIRPKFYWFFSDNFHQSSFIFHDVESIWNMLELLKWICGIVK